MARSAWKFVDPETEDEYFWPVNPNADDGSNVINKNFGYTANFGMRKTTTNVDTIDTLIFQNNVDVKPFKYSGLVYDQAQYNALEEWADKDYPVEVYDDLGRGQLIYIDSITFSRVRSRQNVFKHSYVLTGIVLEEL